jgi:hypothetical protein
LEVATGTFLEARRRHRLDIELEITGIFANADWEPIGWLEIAQEVAFRFRRTQSGRHHLYVALLDGS